MNPEELNQSKEKQEPQQSERPEIAALLPGLWTPPKAVAENEAKKAEEHASTPAKGEVTIPIAQPETRHIPETVREPEPMFTAMAARMSYFALRDKFTPNNAQLKAMLQQSGPVGEQLLQRMGKMEAQGWTFSDLKFNDPYLKLEAPGLFKRAGRMLSLGGYHYSSYEDVVLKRITHNSFNVGLGSIGGASYGRGDPVKHAAVYIAHELSHEDGTLYDYKDWKALPMSEQQTLAKRLLATETRAIVTQLHVAEALGDTHVSNDMLKMALRRRDLGGYIHDMWKNVSDTYGPFKSMDRTQAANFVNQYLDESFGKDLVNPKTGSIRPFDIDAGLGKQVGALGIDHEMALKLASTEPGIATKTTAVERFLMETGSGRFLTRGARSAIALGGLVMVADIRGAFNEGPVSGAGRIARVGADWAGFEAGSVLGAATGRGAALAFTRSRYPLLAIPLTTLAGGIIGAHVTDKYVGERLENIIKAAPTKSTKDLFGV